jgi:hypothetical protein
MHNPDARWRERRTDVRAARAIAPPAVSGRIVEHDLGALASIAVLVTSMLAAGSMRGERSPATVVAATSQLRVKRVDHLGIEPRDGESADGRPYVLLDLAEVPDPRSAFELDDVEPSIEQLVDRRACPRIAALVDLVQQLRQDLLGLAFRLTGRAAALAHRLTEPDVLTTYRVDARIDLDAR